MPFLCLLAGGCYEWVRVPPGELGKLDQPLPPVPKIPPSRQPRATYWAQHGDDDEEAPPPRPSRATYWAQQRDDEEAYPPGEPAARPKRDVPLQTDDGEQVDADAVSGLVVTTEDHAVAFKRPIHCVVTPEQLRVSESGSDPILFQRATVRMTEVHVHKKALSRTAWTVSMALAGVAHFVVLYLAVRNLGEDLPIEQPPGAR